MSNRKFVVARPTYTTYIKQCFLFFCRNLQGRFSFGTQICFNGLLQEPITSAPVYHWESLNAITFVGRGGGGVLYSGWKWTSAMMRKQTCSREPGDKLFRLPEALPLSTFVDCKFDTILSEQHLLAREIIFGITKRRVIPVKIRCRKAWEAAVNLIIIDGDRGMEGKGKP